MSNRSRIGGFGFGLLMLGLVMRYLLPADAPLPMVWFANALPLIGAALTLVVVGLWSSEKSPAVAMFIGLCLSAVGALYVVVGIFGGGISSFISGGLTCLLGGAMIAGYLLKKR